jgi:hypothetical protein
MHREPPTVDAEYKGSKEKQVLNNIKRFSDHRGKMPTHSSREG